MSICKVPDPINVGRPPKWPWATLKVGEMFFVPDKKRNTMSALASATGAKLGRKFSTRLCWMRERRVVGKPKEWRVSGPDYPDAVLGIGCWRVK